MSRARRAVCAVALVAALGAADVRAADAVVELVEIGPGKALEKRFGHILLRVIDRASGRDDTYDFGVGPFDRPLFVLEAMMGRGMFSLRRSPAQVRFHQYWMEGREVVAQRLALTDAQVFDLRARLAVNLRPENRDYLYDHVLDNCATRLRDLIDAVSGGALRRAAEAMPPERTYRDDVRAAGSGWLPALIGYDWVAGRHGEDPIGGWERAFLPEHLAALVAAAENPALGAPLVASTEVLYARSGPPVTGGDVDAGRHLVLAVGAGLGALFAAAGLAARAGRLPLAAGRVVAGLAGATLLSSGLVGLVMLPMRLFSTGHIFSGNANAWLLVPFDWALLGPAAGWLRSGRPELGRVARGYLTLRLATVVLLLLPIHTQQNGAFAAAAGCALAGLRCLPARRQRAS